MITRHLWIYIKSLFIELFFLVRAQSSTSVFIHAKIQIISAHATFHSLDLTYVSSQKKNKKKKNYRQSIFQFSIQIFLFKYLFNLGFYFTFSKMRTEIQKLLKGTQHRVAILEHKDFTFWKLLVYQARYPLETLGALSGEVKLLQVWY